MMYFESWLESEYDRARRINLSEKRKTVLLYLPAALIGIELLITALAFISGDQEGRSERLTSNLKYGFFFWAVLAVLIIFTVVLPNKAKSWSKKIKRSVEAGIPDEREREEFAREMIDPGDGLRLCFTARDDNVFERDELRENYLFKAAYPFGGEVVRLRDVKRIEKDDETISYKTGTGTGRRKVSAKVYPLYFYYQDENSCLAKEEKPQKKEKEEYVKINFINDRTRERILSEITKMKEKTEFI